MTTLFSGYNIANNPGTDRVQAVIKRILVGALLCLIYGSAFGQVQMAIEVTPNNPEPGELLVVRVTVTNAGSTSVSGLQAQVDYPVGLSDMFDALFSDGGDCTDAGNANECDAGETAFWDIGTLPPGAGKTVYMSPAVLTTLGDGTLIPFDGRVFEGSTERAVAASEAVVEENRPLELEVDADREPVAPGGELRYELSFGNQSGTARTDTELRFPLPAGTSLVEASDGGTLIGSEVVWDLATLNPGDSDKRRVTVQLDGSVAAGDIVEVDAAEVSGISNFETRRTRQQATTRVETASQLGFSVDLPAGPLRNDVSSPIHVTVTNRGATVQNGVRAELFFPPGLSDMFDALFSDGGDCSDAGNANECDAGETAFWDIGTLPPGAGKTVTLVPSPLFNNPDGRLLSFFGRAFSDSTPDFWDRRTIAIEDDRPLELEVDADREPVAPGGELRYELSFGNRSGTARTDTELRFPLPAGTSLVEASDGGTLVGNEVVWDLATLNPGDSDKRRVTVQLDGSVADGDIVEVDAAEVSGISNFETRRTRQQATTRVETASQLGFSVDLPAGPLRNDVSSPIHVTVTNRGATVQNGVRAELFFPPGLSDMFDALFSDGGDCSDAGNANECDAGETAFWDIGTLPPGAGKTVTLVPSPLFNNPDGRLLSFFGRAFSDSTPDFWDRRTIAIEDDRPLELEVDADREPVAPGGELRYELSFGNRSGTARTDTELRFPLPAGTSLVEASDGGTLVGNEVVWDLATLNPGDSDKRRVTVQLDGSVADGDIVEVDAAEVSGISNFETRRTRQQATTRVETASQLGFSVDLPAGPLRNDVSSPIHVTVTNRGATVQNGVRAELFFPPGLSDMFDALFSDGGDCSDAGNANECDAGETAFWDIGTLPPGAGKTVTLVPSPLFNNPDGRLLSFFGRAFSDSTPDFWDRRTIAIEDDRPLELEVDADREPVAPGGELRYELSFGNRSGTARTDTELRFPLPAGTSLVEANDGGTLVGNEVVWDLATLNPGDSDKRRVTVQLDGSVADGDIVEVDAAEVSGISNFETRRTRQQATTRVETASQLGFSVDLPAGPLRNDVSSPIHVTVTNRGATVQNGVRAELFFPPGLSDMFDALFSDGGDCTDAGNANECDAGETAFWDIGTLPPGAGKTVTLVPSPLFDNSDGRLLAFFGRVFALGTPDFWERRSVAINDARALNLEIDAATNPVPGNTTIDYSITAGNQGESAATMTRLTLPVPPGTSVLSADGNADITADSITWNMGTLESGQATRRNLTLSLDTPLDPGDILELGSGALTADGLPATRNSATVRTKNNRDLNQLLSLTPETALPGTTVFADTVVNNDSAVQVADVTTETAVLGTKETFDIGLMNPGTSESRTLELTLATGSNAFDLGTLLNFSSRLRSSSTDGDFQTRTLIIGDEIPPPPPPDPEIEVSGNGIEIVDGDTTPSSADGTDFGSADFDGETVQRNFVIANTNTGDLEITGVSISGQNQADFAILSGPASTIPGGEQSTLTIEFDPDNVGARTATVSIANNDDDENPYTFAIAGEGTDATGELIFKNGFE